MTLMNHVILQSGVPAVMHFTNHVIEPRMITDPVSRLEKTVNALVFHVDQLNGQSVDAYYSTISDKHALFFDPYLKDQAYRDYLFTITRQGRGFSTDYTVKIERRS